MKKIVCLIVVFIMIFGASGCNNNNTMSDSKKNSSSSTTFDLNSLEYKVETKNGEKVLNIYNENTLLQTIKYDEVQNITKSDYYFEDVNFDGMKDLILPAASPAYGMWFHTYKWDNEKNKFVRFKSIDEMTNPVIDYENKQILHHSSKDQMESFVISKYNDVGELINVASLFWEPAYKMVDVLDENKDKIFVREEKEGIIKEFFVPTDSESNIGPDFNCDEFKEYTENDSYWNLKSTKWQDYFFK